MKIILMNEKMKKYILDLIFKIKKKHQASDSDNKFTVAAGDDDDVAIIDDNNDGIELLAIISSLGNDEVL